MANTRPGISAFSIRVLFHRLGKEEGEEDENDDEIDEEEESSLSTQVTVRDVLKYSLHCVITPSVRVQACTQKTFWSGSWPSTRTVDPRTLMELGSKSKGKSEERPVSNRIICWWVGGPWNHHSMSGASSRCTVSTSRALNASYRACTTLSFLDFSSSSLARKLARSGSQNPPSLRQGNQQRKKSREKERRNENVKKRN